MQLIPNSLRDRIEDYQGRTDLKLLPRVPLIIAINGRSFSKTTSLLEKPFSQDLLECFCGSLIKLINEIQGAIFGYHYNDQIIIICRNDQHNDTHPWYDNSVQKISSVAASITTLEFNRLAQSKNLDLLGSTIFTAHTFAVPNFTEVINALLHFQQDAFQQTLSLACFYELIKNRDAQAANLLLANKTPQEKAKILFEETGVEYNTYPVPFKRGVACYKTPHRNSHQELKYKSILQLELPLFSQDKEWLIDIFKNFKN